MKKFIIAAALTLAVSVFASEAKDEALKPGEIEKKGFLATQWCIENSYFKDCRLESLVTSPLALFVHGEGVTYKLDTTNAAVAEIEENVGRNAVTIIGTLEAGNVIKVRTHKAPPPEGKSFFKGCL